MDKNCRITQCRICKSHNVVPFVEVPSLAHKGMTCRFAVCNDCNTVMDEGSPTVSYKESPAMDQMYTEETVLRYYVEVGAGIEFMARVMSGLSEAHQPRGDGRPRFLDVGAGFGFACSIAKFLGWDVVGVEPSQMGAAGERLLGLPLLREYLEQTDLPREHFDFVYSSEVIEHVQDVDQFVATVAAYLKPDGVLLFTTPNGEAVRGREAVEGEWVEALSPGYHLNLLSPKSMEMVLRRHGMATVHIMVGEGTSGKKRLMAMASRTPGHPALPPVPWAKMDIKPFLRSYLKDLVEQREKKGETDVVYRGALFRLIESLVNAGAFAEAEAAIAKMERALDKMGMPPTGYHRIQPCDLPEYLAQAPAFAGVYVYYKGIYYLNYKNDYDRALEWLRLAQHLCTLEKKIPYFTRLYWPAQCQFHVGLALLYGGRKREALHEFDALLAEPEKLPEGMKDQLLWSKSVAHLQLGENIRAARYFADTWLHRQFADTPSHLVPLLHMTMALAQVEENKASELQAIEMRVKDYVSHHFAEFAKRGKQVQQQIRHEVEEVRQKFDVMAARMDAVANALRPFLQAARPVAKRMLSLARRGRSGYRWLRDSARAGVRSVRVAVGLPVGPIPASSLHPVETPLGELVAGHTIEQAFVCVQNGLSALGIKISTCHRELTSSLDLAIFDASGRCLREIRTSACRFHDNHIHYFAFPPIVESRGKNFTLRLSAPDAAAKNAVTLWTRPGTGRGLRLDGRPQSAELVFEMLYSSPSSGQRDLLLVCPDHLGRIRIGIGMRHWEIARTLTARGVSVTLATPHRFDPDLQGDGFPVVHVPTDRKMIALAVSHRSVMIQGNILDQFPSLGDSNIPIVVDMITPMHIENFDRTAADFEHSHRLLAQAMMRGDFFICGNERQRLHWLGMLAGLGRLPFHAKAEHPELRRLIDLVPFGIPDAPPVKTRSVLKGVRAGIGPDDFVLTWFGGIWDWFDPLPIVRAVGAAWKRDPRIKLFFSAYRCPDGTVSNMAQRVRKQTEELGLLDRCVFFNDYPVPFDERADYLLETDAGILCQARNLETQVAARTRVLDYLWADCPLLINDGDEWSQVIRQNKLGMVVDENRVELWTEAILDLCRDAEGRARMQANIQQIKQQLCWNACVEPLVQFVARRHSANTERLAA